MRTIHLRPASKLPGSSLPPSFRSARSASPARPLQLALGAVLFLALTLPGAARAQIVNVQPLLKDGDKPGLSGAVDLAADWRTGNTRLLLLSGSAIGQLRAGRHLLFLLARGELGIQGGRRFSNKNLEHLRYRLNVLEWLHAETFLQHDADELRRLVLRSLWGFGPRLLVHEGPRLHLSLGFAYMLELERLAPGAQPDAGEERLSHRLSSYGVLQLRLSDTLRASETVYVQPRLDRPQDMRVLSETELLIAVAEHVALKAAVTLAYDSEPPSGLSALDTSTRLQLHLAF